MKRTLAISLLMLIVLPVFAQDTDIILIQPEESYTFEASPEDERWPIIKSDSVAVAAENTIKCIKFKDSNFSIDTSSTGYFYIRDKNGYDSRLLIPTTFGVDQFCTLYKVTITNPGPAVFEVWQ